MARPSTIPGGRLPIALTSLLLLVAAAGCAPESDVDAVPLDSSEGQSLAADDPGASCDDGNPCTAKADCTPCSTVPPEARDTLHCTPDDELPPFCAGRTGCVQVPLTTPAGQVDSCFPVVGASDAHAGSCRAGLCVENEG